MDRRGRYIADDLPAGMSVRASFATKQENGDVLHECIPARRSSGSHDRGSLGGKPMLYALNGSTMPAIRLENLTVSYDRKPAVHHVNGAFEAGSLTAVAGPNGAGKSTLLKTIAGILRADEGSVHISGSQRPVAYLPQKADVQRDIPITVLELVSSGFWTRSGAFRTIRKQERQAAVDALEKVGLGGFEKRNLASLSVGQFQRTLFARLIVQDAPLILLDEPFAGVDALTMERLHDLIMSWHSEHRTIICVLHDLDMIRASFPRCLLMARECIAWGPSREVLRPDKLTKAGSFHGTWPAHAEPCVQ